MEQADTRGITVDNSADDVAIKNDIGRFKQEVGRGEHCVKANLRFRGSDTEHQEAESKSG